MARKRIIGEDQRERFLGMAKWLTEAEMAARYNCTTQTVRNYLARWAPKDWAPGLPPQTPALSTGLPQLAQTQEGYPPEAEGRGENEQVPA